jgi:hypothetical protein
LKGTTTGEELFLKVQETLVSLELSWVKLKNVTTDGGKNTCGSKTGVVGRICKEVTQVGSNSDGISLHHSSGGIMLPNFVTEGCYGHCYFNSDVHSTQWFDPPSVPALFGRN